MTTAPTSGLEEGFEFKGEKQAQISGACGYGFDDDDGFDLAITKNDSCNSNSRPQRRVPLLHNPNLVFSSSPLCTKAELVQKCNRRRSLSEDSYTQTSAPSQNIFHISYSRTLHKTSEGANRRRRGIEDYGNGEKILGIMLYHHD